MQSKDYITVTGPYTIRVTGHRMGIETILFDYLEEGMSAGRRLPGAIRRFLVRRFMRYWPTTGTTRLKLISICGEFGNWRKSNGQSRNAILHPPC